MEFDYILRVGLDNGQEDLIRSHVYKSKTIEEASKAVETEIIIPFANTIKAGTVFTLKKHDEGVVVSWNTKYVTRIATEIVEREEKKDD